MAALNFVEKKIPGNLLTEFEDYNASVYSVKLSNQEDEIVAFCVQFNDQSTLESNWSRLNNAIAADFQSNLTSEFSAWNIYLVIWCKQRVSKSIKYKVENDKAFIRKLVIDNCQLPDSSSYMTQYLDALLLGKDLLQVVDSEVVETEPYNLSRFTRLLIESESNINNILDIWKISETQGNEYEA